MIPSDIQPDSFFHSSRFLEHVPVMSPLVLELLRTYAVIGLGIGQIAGCQNNPRLYNIDGILAKLPELGDTCGILENADVNVRYLKETVSIFMEWSVRMLPVRTR